MKKKTREIYLHLQKSGDFIYTSTRKGSNPLHEKMPMLKCPVCKKNLHSVFDAKTKNDAFLFDVDDPKYKNHPRDHVCKCSRCHHAIGVYYLSVKDRRKLGLPLEHECHEKIKLA